MMEDTEQVFETVDLNSVFAAADRGFCIDRCRSSHIAVLCSQNACKGIVRQPAPTRCRRRCRTITANRVEGCECTLRVLGLSQRCSWGLLHSGSREALVAGWYPTFRDHLMDSPPLPRRTGISLLSLLALFKNVTPCNLVVKTNVSEETYRIEILTARLWRRVVWWTSTDVRFHSRLVAFWLWRRVGWQPTLWKNFHDLRLRRQ
jgi:hypothetical protein